MIQIGDSRIITLFDTPHLEKGERNNLLTKDLEVDVSEAAKNPSIPSKFVEWRFFEKAY